MTSKRWARGVARAAAIATVAWTVAACGGTPGETGAGATVQGATAQGSPAAEARPANTFKGGDNVIASYAGKSFTEADLRSELAALNRRSRKALDDPDRRKQFVENHIMSQLIFEEGRKKGIDQDAEIRGQLRNLERRLVIQKVMQDHQSAPVDDEEIRSYYDSHPDEFSSDRVQASHILVKEEALAAELLAKIEEDPTQFDALAEEHSIDKSNASRGGDLGFFTRGRMVKEFEEAAFGLEADGELSPVIKTRFGYHIIKRTGREDGKMKPFDDVKNQIRIRLINDKRKSQTEDFLTQLKSGSGYELDVQALSTVDLSDMNQGEDEPPAAPPGHGGH